MLISKVSNSDCTFGSPRSQDFFPLIFQKIKNYGKHLPAAILASVYYRFPTKKMIVIGVTGTDGKTTTANLIYHLLSSAGLKVGLVSTVGAKIGNEEVDIGLHVTSPNPWLLQKLLKQMTDRGIDYVVLETTSHGLDQFRFWGIDFEIGILTNVTYEHLDYHRTMDEYLKAKAILLKKAKIVVLNRDDWSYEQLITKYRNLEAKTVTYGVEDGADFNPKKFRFKTTLPGDYNQHNCLAAIAATSRLGLNEEKIKDAVATFKGVLGRMDEIKEGQDFKVFVDFAHTPNALEQVLSTLKKQTSSSSRLITVFGSAGFRDRGKRPIMGEVACRLADLVVLTTDDPRTEDANQIIDEIAVGCQKAGGKEGLNYYRVPNRQEAINFAIQKLAKKGDIVALCGKGHERSLTIGQNEYPWSEHQAARKSLEKITKVGQK